MLRWLAPRLLSVLILPIAAWLTLATVQLPRQAYTGIAVLSDRVMSVDPGSPAERAGLRVDDRIREFAPSPGPPGVGLDPRASLTPGVPVLLTRERAGRAERVWVAPSALPESERRLRTGLLVVAAGFLVLGGWVWAERRDRLTRVFWLLCAAFAIVLAGAPRASDARLHGAFELVATLAQLALPALFVHFFGLFPVPPRSGRTPAVARVFWSAVLAVGTGWLWQVLSPVPITGLYEALVVASGVLLAAGVLVGVALFFAAFARHPDRDARRRLRVALAGTVLGAAPFALVIGSRSLAPGWPVPGERLSVLATLLVPASFAWAIAVHRVFDFRVALRAIAALAAAALAAVGLFALANALAPLGLPQLGPGALGAAIMALLFFVARIPAVRAGMMRLGSRVVPIADERTLATWRSPVAADRDRPEDTVLESACEAVMVALRLDGCAAVRAVGPNVRTVAHAGAARRVELGGGFLRAASRRVRPGTPRALDLPEEDRDVLEAAGVHWTLGVPGDPPPAALLLGRRLTGAWLDEHESRELEQFADHLAVALENAELRREARSRGAMDRALEVAHDIQVRRLPRRAPVFPTLDCAAASLSSEAVGGDFYDFVQDAPRAFTLAVGDAAGHGVPAALVQAGVQAHFRDAAARARGPVDVLASLNRQLVAIEQPEKFMGLLCARVDVAAGTVRLANAGLTPPLLRRADGRTEELSAGGLLLGVSADADYESVAVELGPGDVLVAFTDGLTEATRGGRMFGPEGVRRVLDAHAHRRAADLVEELMHAVRDWADAPMDDLTVVVLKQLTPAASARLRPARPALKLEALPSDNSR